MQSIIEGFGAAFRLIVTLNPELVRIILLSLEVSGTALLLATVLGCTIIDNQIYHDPFFNCCLDNFYSL